MTVYIRKPKNPLKEPNQQSNTVAISKGLPNSLMSSLINQEDSEISSNLSLESQKC